MPDSVIHLIVPLFILLLLVRKETRKLCFILAPIALFPDIDILYQHRAFLHNIFLPTILLILAYFAKDNLKQKILILCSFYMFSHIFLDIFYGGIEIFYPFITNTFLIRFDIMMNANHTISIVTDSGFKGFSIGESKWNDIFVANTISIGITIFVFIVYVLKKIFVKDQYVS